MKVPQGEQFQLKTTYKTEKYMEYHVYDKHNGDYSDI